jgi:hypothetical protein
MISGKWGYSIWKILFFRIGPRIGGPMDKLVEQLMKEKVQMKAEIFYLNQKIKDLEKDLTEFMNPPEQSGPEDKEEFWTNT